MRFICLFMTVACVWSGCKETPEATTTTSPPPILSTQTQPEVPTTRPENVASKGSGRVGKPPRRPQVVVGRATMAVGGPGENRSLNVEPLAGGVSAASPNSGPGSAEAVVSVMPREPVSAVVDDAGYEAAIVQALIDSWQERMRSIESQGLSREDVRAQVEAVTDDVVASIEARDASGRWNDVIGNVVQQASDFLDALTVASQEPVPVVAGSAGRVDDEEIVQALVDSWEERVKDIQSQGVSREDVRAQVEAVTDDVVASIEARDASGRWNDVIGHVVQQASDFLDAFTVAPQEPVSVVAGSGGQVDDEEIVQALVDSWEERVKHIQSQGLSREEVRAQVKVVTDDVVASIEERDGSGRWNDVIGNVVQQASDFLDALNDPCLDRIARAEDIFKTRVEPRAVKALLLTGRPRVVSGYALYGLDAELLRVMRDFDGRRDCRRDFDAQIDGWKTSLNDVIRSATEVRRNVYMMFGDMVTQPAAESDASAGERSDEIFAAVETLEVEARKMIATLQTHASAALLQPLVESLESFATEQIGRLRSAADKMRGVVAQRSLEGYVVQANRVLVPLAQVFGSTRAASTQKGAEAYASKILRANAPVWPRAKHFEAGFLAQVTAELVKHIPATLPEASWRSVLGSVQEANRFKALYESKTV